MNTVTLDNVKINVSSPEQVHMLTGTNLNILKRGGALFGFYNPKTKDSFARAQYVLPTTYNGWYIKRLASMDNEAVEAKFIRYPLGKAVSHLGTDPVIIAAPAPAPDIAVALPKAPKAKAIKTPAKPKGLKKKPVTTVNMDTLTVPVSDIAEPIPFEEQYQPNAEELQFAMQHA